MNNIKVPSIFELMHGSNLLHILITKIRDQIYMIYECWKNYRVVILPTGKNREKILI